MKLNTNILSPAAALFTESGLLRHLSSVRRSLSIAYRGVLAQRQLLDRAMRQGDDVSIEELAKAIDAVVEQTVVADSVPILDGRCARGSYSLSLWFMAVDRPPRYYHEDLRHRMYVPTMTARTLSLRPPPRPEHNSQLLAQSRQAIRKAAADLRAYLQRLRLVERRVRRQAEQAISHVNRRSPALTEQQLRDHYMDDLQHLEDVLLHLRVVVHRARRPQLSAFDRQLLQVEVSQWVDELEVHDKRIVVQRPCLARSGLRSRLPGRVDVVRSGRDPPPRLFAGSESRRLRAKDNARCHRNRIEPGVSRGHPGKSPHCPEQGPPRAAAFEE